MAREVKIYTTPGCPYCRMAKKFLDDRGDCASETGVPGLFAAGEGAEATFQAHCYLQRLSQ